MKARVSDKYNSTDKVKIARRPEMAIVEGANRFVPKTSVPGDQAQNHPPPAAYGSLTCENSYGILHSEVGP